MNPVDRLKTHITLGYRQPYPNMPFFQSRGLAGKPHRGVDQAPLPQFVNEPIFVVAPVAGELVFAQYHNQYGFMVALINIDQGTEYLHFLAHNERIRKGIAKGLKVQKGEILALMGSTGTSTAKHLHYQVEVKLEEGQQSHWWVPGSWRIINPKPFMT